MTHPRTRLRQHFLNLLDQVAFETQVHIFDDNPRTVPPESIQVLIVSEDVTDEDIELGIGRRVVELQAVCRTTRHEAQAALDELAWQVEGAWLADGAGDWEAGTPAAEVRYVTSALDLDSQQGDRVSTLTVAFEVAYFPEGA